MASLTAPVEVQSLLTEVSPAEPCGANLEYDAGFAALERAAQPKPEQQIGETIVPAEEPDWKVVQKQAGDLFVRTKDLRIGCHLVRALLRTSGIIGFAAGLEVVRGLVERYWAGVHPQLDPDDGLDPTMRVNILMGLCDPDGVTEALRVAPLVTARGIGRFSLRDLQVALGEAPPATGTEAPSLGTIDAAFLDSPLEDLQATSAAVKSALTHVQAVEAFVGEQVGAASGTNFMRLTTLLRQADKLVDERLARRGLGTEGDGAAGGGPENGQPGRAGMRGSPLQGDIGSREDVVRALDKILDYYRRQEPSSPVPLLIERCKRLVTMHFLDVVRELAPEALAQFQVHGPREKAEGSEPS